MRYGRLSALWAIPAILLFATWVDQADAKKAGPGTIIRRISDASAAAANAARKQGPHLIPLGQEAPSRAKLALEMDSAQWCDGYWQGEPALRSLEWIIGIEVYASYQDPSEIVCENTYPFHVSDVYWILVVDVGSTIRMQPVIASNVGTPECPFPGDILCLGDLDSLWFDPGVWLIQMPYDSIECIVNEPYFACVFLPDEIVPGTCDLVLDADTLDPMPCRSYDDWGEGWQDLSAAFANMVMWSEGTTEATVCGCDCFGDPQCDGVANVFDVVQAVDVAFRGGTAAADPNADCPRVPVDVSCDSVTNVFDVVALVDVAFRGGDPASVFCDPCAP